MERKEIKLKLCGVKAEILYHKYLDVDVNTLLVSFKEKHRVLSTWDGYREVYFVANSHQPPELEVYIMKHYPAYEEAIPKILEVPRSSLALISTAAHMDNLAVCEKSYRDRAVCCLATGGVGNALRTGVDKAKWIEEDGTYVNTLGTINIIIVTNAALTDGAMARAIITVTEAKTAALQDMDARSTVSPELQATGTGTDNVVVVSGNWKNKPLISTGGHTKIGELIGASTKTAVAEAVKKHEAYMANKSQN